ncbi:phosphoserine phosphatase SerB [Candidatus Neomicrothrix sp.]|uniref:phosphoserine phosphatase SerB n=1 Tax=Candidatus Neomicrothrix sp. TaxID=2719034 RepID=UPI001B6B7D73|nr:phosphoserine phosphatase SerB [Candidatus Microthrix sp.]MBP6136076.1 phosphoserine phosphatase SerB [Candidatus Microthrix sp.]MBP6150992.1 phosphoserine phosphatase SerB [Candidatus Microthrix sp.]MBP7987683.1 phosphoserine phosphatase SerB [Candidatus Microthrix sp.]MBP7994925.1 phosphoserine phosphatase SerB [Candidatus Microthrix sp.]
MTNLAIRVVGADHPGITADLMSTLAALGADLQDVEQVLVRQRLVLAAVVGTERPESVRREMAAFAERHDLSVELDDVADADARPVETQIITVLAPRITPAALEIITDTLGSLGANIDRIVRLARYPVYCYELRVSGADAEEIRTRVTAAGAAARVDVAVQRETLGRRAMRLVAFDVDSTLIQGELIDEVAKVAGCGDEVAAITAAAMAGELDFEAALRARVALLEGVPADVLTRVAREVPFTPGARTLVATLKRLGFTVVAFSGGFTMMTDIVGDRLGLDATHANDLEVLDGRLTGRLTGRVVDRARKGELLGELASQAGIPLEQTVAVGDGANDLDMLGRAGLGIAFNAKTVLREVADAAISVPYLDVVLFLLGVGRSDVERERLTRVDPPPAEFS